VRAASVGSGSEVMARAKENGSIASGRTTPQPIPPRANTQTPTPSPPRRVALVGVLAYQGAAAARGKPSTTGMPPTPRTPTAFPQPASPTPSPGLCPGVGHHPDQSRRAQSKPCVGCTVGWRARTHLATSMATTEDTQGHAAVVPSKPNVHQPYQIQVDLLLHSTRRT